MAGRKLAGRDGPPSVVADLDRDHLVSLRVERVDDRLGRRERDRVLRRATSHQHRDPPAGHCETVVVSVETVVVVVGTVVVGAVVTGAT